MMDSRPRITEKELQRAKHIRTLLESLENIVFSNSLEKQREEARFLHFRLNRQYPMQEDINIAEDYLGRVYQRVE